MAAEHEYCMVMTTFSDEVIGKKIIHSLIEKRLAACVQVQAIESYYHWKGEVNQDQEKAGDDQDNGCTLLRGRGGDTG